jgi:DNA modification methylase
VRQTICWVKDAFVLGRQDYHWQHELLFYGWAPGARHTWLGGRDQSTVWQFARPRRSPEHPTQKPVALVERALRNSSRPGAAVLDPFLGSGTTLIACERLDRRGFGVELDPRYAQVAIERWEALTGEEAQRVD